MKLSDNKYWLSIKKIITGLILISIAIVFWLNIVGNPFGELMLIINNESCTGYITKTWEDWDFSEGGSINYTSEITYQFSIPNGKLYVNTIKHFTELRDDLKNISEPYPITVEYVTSNPEISRIKGDGNQTIFEWLWRKVGLGGIALFLLLAPGFIVTKDAIKELIKINKPDLNHGKLSLLLELLARGKTKLDFGDYQSAIEDFNKVIELNSNDSKAYYYRGIAKNYLKDKDGAIDDLRKAGELGNNEAFDSVKKIIK